MIIIDVGSLSIYLRYFCIFVEISRERSWLSLPPLNSFYGRYGRQISRDHDFRPDKKRDFFPGTEVSLNAVQYSVHWQLNKNPLWMFAISTVTPSERVTAQCFQRFHFMINIKRVTFLPKVLPEWFTSWIIMYKIIQC